ncbi:MAG TPA: M23 family metallopeptidase, partial [Spirochaetes bacterium]|nr:M23 family metallopeptidase [Spirochaetota bacterium]
MNGLPITRYQIGQIKLMLRYGVMALLAVFFLGNIAALIFIKKIRVNPEHYVIREGVPFFSSSDEYIKLIKNYHHRIGAKVVIHTMRMGESYWDTARRYNVSIDTIIAANPFLTSLSSREGMKIVVPREDGVLMAADNLYDVYRMKKLLGPGTKARGEYRQSLFRLFSLDDLRFVFYPGARPVLVNARLQDLYNIRRTFQNPLRGGLYSSLYGDRVDPMREGMAFHNGVDIQARMGTPIHPVRDGMVSLTGWMDGYGLTV